MDRIERKMNQARQDARDKVRAILPEIDTLINSLEMEITRDLSIPGGTGKGLIVKFSINEEGLAGAIQRTGSQLSFDEAFHLWGVVFESHLLNEERLQYKAVVEGILEAAEKNIAA